MKIIIVGDLHGGFPSKMEKEIRKENADLILSTGDFANFDEYRKAVFSNVKKTKSFDKKVKDNFNKEQYEEMVEKIIGSMEKPLKIIDSFNIPVYTIYGNLDYTNYEVNKHKVRSNSLNRLSKKSKNLKVVREKILDFNDLQILMFSGFRKIRIKKKKKKIKS